MLERPEHPPWIRQQWVDVFDSLGDVGGALAQYCGWSGVKKLLVAENCSRCRRLVATIDQLHERPKEFN